MRQFASIRSVAANYRNYRREIHLLPSNKVDRDTFRLKTDDQMPATIEKWIF